MPYAPDDVRPVEAGHTALPLVSIIVSNFNYAQFLRKSIDSALAQTYSNVEVVVVDDASSDGSTNIIRSYGDDVVAVLLDRNSGQAAAINAGFAASSGEVVIFLDADDYLYANAAAQVASALTSGVATIQYRLHLVDTEGRVIDMHPPPELAFDSGNVVAKVLNTGRYEGNVTSGNAFTRSTLSEILPIPTDKFRIGADGYLVTVAPFHGIIISIDEPLGAYRQHTANYWSGSSLPLAYRCRRSILHDAEKHRVLAQCARARGFNLRPQPGMRDWQHLQARIGSLTLDPKNHPDRSDTRIGLALRGACAIWQARLPGKRRAIVAAWFLSLGLLPSHVARRHFLWYFESSSRSDFVKRVLKAVRRATR